MSAQKPSRRDFLKAAGIVVGAAAGASMRALPAGAAAPDALAPQAVEMLADYGSHTGDGRSATIISSIGQQLKITAYGNYIVRVRSIRSGETFFADDRYELVDPANHAAWVAL